MAETVYDFNGAIATVEKRVESIAELKNQIFGSEEFDTTRNEEIEMMIDGELCHVPRKEILLNLVISKPFITFEYTFGSEDWMNSEQDLSSCLDLQIDKFAKEDMQILNAEISVILMDLADIASDTNIRVGTSISMHELREILDSDPELLEMYNTSFEGSTSFKDIEGKINELNKIAIKKLSTSDSSYAELIKGGAINKDQFKQVLINIGPKPNLEG